MDTNAYTLRPIDVARLLHVHRDTVKAWTDKGLLPCWRTPTKHRRYRLEDVEALRERAA